MTFILLREAIGSMIVACFNFVYIQFFNRTTREPHWRRLGHGLTACQSSTPFNKHWHLFPGPQLFLSCLYNTFNYNDVCIQPWHTRCWRNEVFPFHGNIMNWRQVILEEFSHFSLTIENKVENEFLTDDGRTDADDRILREINLRVFVIRDVIRAIRVIRTQMYFFCFYTPYTYLEYDNNNWKIWCCNVNSLPFDSKLQC